MPSANELPPLIIYHTETGNTTPVAEAMAESLSADIAIAEQVKDEQLLGRPIIGLGSGVYYMKHHASLYSVVDRLPGGCKVFVFTTSGIVLGPVIRFYQWRLLRRLEQRGVEVIGQWHCPGHDQQPAMKPFKINKGRPDRGDLDAAGQFARSMI